MVVSEQEGQGGVYQDITLYDLVFENRGGLRVRVEGLSTGDLLDFIGLADQIPGGGSAQKLDPETKQTVLLLMETLAGALVEWNVADRDGKVRPADMEGLRACNLALVMDIATAWVSAQTDVDGDLGKDSGSAGTSGLERSMPMEPLSPSPGN
jgi:hypothetical protein